MAEGAVVDPDRHVYGNVDAAVTVVEYGDFECPYCGAAAPVLKALVDGSGGKVRLVFRHFPLFTKHPFALTAALAAEASGEHFWELHDLLFANQEHLTDSDLARFGAQVGAHDVVGAAAQAFRPAIEADYGSGAEMGVRGTPSLYIDGQLYTGRVDLRGLRAAADVGR